MIRRKVAMLQSILGSSLPRSIRLSSIREILSKYHKIRVDIKCVKGSIQPVLEGSVSVWSWSIVNTDNENVMCIRVIIPIGLPLRQMMISER